MVLLAQRPPMDRACFACGELGYVDQRHHREQCTDVEGSDDTTRGTDWSDPSSHEKTSLQHYDLNSLPIGSSGAEKDTERGRDGKQSEPK